MFKSYLLHQMLKTHFSVLMMIGFAFILGSAAPRSVFCDELPVTETFYDHQFESISKQLRTHPSNPESLALLYRLQELFPYLSTPERHIRFCEQLTASKNVPFDLRVAAGWSLWRQAWRSGDASAIIDARRNLGLITRWMIIGPFSNEGGTGHETVFPPESAFDPQQSYPGKERSVSWRPFPDISKMNGYQNLRVAFNPSSYTSAYAFTRIYSPKSRDAILLLGAGGTLKAWLNEKQVAEWGNPRPNRPWQSAYRIRLKRGMNDLLLKISGRDGDWGYRAAILDRKGRAINALAGLESDENAATKAPFPSTRQNWKLSSKGNSNKSFTLSVDRLIKRDTKHPTSRNARLISLLLMKQHPYSPEQNLHAEWALRAIERKPNDPEALLHCAEAIDDPNRRHSCLLNGARLFPENPRFSLELARFFISEGQPVQARNWLLPVLERESVLIEAQLLWSQLLDERNHRAEAIDLLHDLHRRFPTVRSVKRALAEHLEMLDLDKESDQIHRVLIQNKANIPRDLRWQYDNAVKHKDSSTAIKITRQILSLRPGNLPDLLRLSKLQSGSGHDSKARITLQKALSIAPEDTTILERLAELEHRSGNAEKALELWNRSLAIAPQNPDLKRYLLHLTPESNTFEVPYVQDALFILSRRPATPETEESAEELLSSDVWKVFENGLSSHFKQSIVRVYDENGIKNFQQFGIRYSPERQEVKILKARVFKPDGRVSERYSDNDHSVNKAYQIYFDYRVRVVTFPDLEPGDVVELQYRIDDIAAENLFSDYFGTLDLLQGRYPIRERQFVILIPKKKPLYHNTPKLSLEPQTTYLDNGDLEYRWKAENVAKIPSEPKSPPLVEQADVLHVSTFKDWSTLGTWYWGLIRDQFIAKEDLKRVVKELINGLDNPLDRVRMIYQWVVTNTRYIGLEFGIHSYKPYQVNRIFERRFGDCKDKATLLVTMLTEAGIRAQMAIIRTNNLGSLAAYPPSLAVFNHAIAYLPDYDLYLDGTAEFSGPFELPVQDRHGQVMLVSEKQTTFTRVPLPDPSTNIYRQTTLVDLTVNDQASLENTIRIEGSRAAIFRRHFQDVKKRHENLEKLVNRDHPGTVVENYSFDNLEDILKPVELSYQATLPDFLRHEGHEIIAPISIDKIDLVKRFASLSTREHPVMIDRLQTIESTLRLHLNGRFKLLNIPSPQAIDTDFGSFRMTVIPEDGDLLISHTLVFRQDRIEVKDYPDFHRFCQEVTQAFKQELRFEELTHE